MLAGAGAGSKGAARSAASKGRRWATCAGGGHVPPAQLRPPACPPPLPLPSTTPARVSLWPTSELRGRLRMLCESLLAATPRACAPAPRAPLAPLQVWPLQASSGLAVPACLPHLLTPSASPTFTVAQGTDPIQWIDPSGTPEEVGAAAAAGQVRTRRRCTAARQAMPSQLLPLLPLLLVKLAPPPRCFLAHCGCSFLRCIPPALRRLQAAFGLPCCPMCARRACLHLPSPPPPPPPPSPPTPDPLCCSARAAWCLATSGPATKSSVTYAGATTRQGSGAVRRAGGVRGSTAS